MVIFDFKKGHSGYRVDNGFLKGRLENHFYCNNPGEEAEQRVVGTVDTGERVRRQKLQESVSHWIVELRGGSEQLWLG